MSADWLERLDAAPAVRLARRALGEAEGVWVVGGALRDAALGRPVLDLDLAVAEGERAVARALADAAGGDVYPLSEEFAAWRALAPGGEWHIDVSRLRGGEGIGADLAWRDFGVNAMALPLGGGEPIDPHGGRADLAARRLRALGERTFADDPLRLLRCARLAAELGFEVEPGTAALARATAARAAEPSGERQLNELRKLVSGPDPVRGLALIDELSLTGVVLPELAALRGVEQNPYHHLDVHGHTVAVLEQLVEVEGRTAELFDPHGEAIDALLAEPLADGLSRGGALRFGALFHDLGKPETRSIGPDGRILFLGHDRAGVARVRAICRRLHTSRTLRRFLEALTRHHLRLGFLVGERPLSRQSVYRYLAATAPVAVEVTVLSVADRLATRGPKTRDAAVEEHLALARRMAGEALAWRRSGPPGTPIAGDQLARELGIPEGPELGRLLEEVRAAVFAGEVATREQAIELARKLKKLKLSSPPHEG